MYGIRKLHRWIFSFTLFLTVSSFIGAGAHLRNSPTDYIECTVAESLLDLSGIYHFVMAGTFGQYQITNSFLNFDNRVFLAEATALIRTEFNFLHKIFALVKSPESTGVLKLLRPEYQDNEIYHYLA